MQVLLSVRYQIEYGDQWESCISTTIRSTSPAKVFVAICGSSRFVLCSLRQNAQPVWCRRSCYIISVTCSSTNSFLWDLCCRRAFCRRVQHVSEEHDLSTLQETLLCTALFVHSAHHGSLEASSATISEIASLSRKAKGRGMFSTFTSKHTPTSPTSHHPMWRLPASKTSGWPAGVMSSAISAHMLPPKPLEHGQVKTGSTASDFVSSTPTQKRRTGSRLKSFFHLSPAMSGPLAKERNSPATPRSLASVGRSNTQHEDASSDLPSRRGQRPRKTFVPSSAPLGNPESTETMNANSDLLATGSLKEVVEEGPQPSTPRSTGKPDVCEDPEGVGPLKKHQRSLRRVLSLVAQSAPLGAAAVKQDEKGLNVAFESDTETQSCISGQSATAEDLHDISKSSPRSFTVSVSVLARCSVRIIFFSIYARFALRQSIV